MKRVQQWQTKFSDFISAKKQEKFSWGTNDCCLFAADSVLCLTGTDFAESFRGKYDSAAGAARLLNENGGVEAIASKYLGTPVLPAFAAVGDVVSISNGGRAALAVCAGQFVLAVSERGLESLALSEAVLAWKV